MKTQYIFDDKVVLESEGDIHLGASFLLKNGKRLQVMEIRKEENILKAICKQIDNFSDDVKQ